MSGFDHAAEFAKRAHDSIGHARKYTGEPYWKHPLAVAAIIQDHGLPAEVVAAACLHDVLEDVAPKRPEFGADAIRAEFGEAVLALVLEVSDVSRPADGNREARKALDRAHYARASSHGQSIKLADLIDNTRDIAAHDPSFARTYLREKEAILAVMDKGDPRLYALAQQTLAEAWVSLVGR